MLSRVAVHLSSDELKAFVEVSDVGDGDYPEREEIEEALRRGGVVFGVREELLESIVTRQVCGRSVEIARGRAPTEGSPGRLEYLIDTSKCGTPRRLENGSVDLRDLQTIVNVAAGTPLVRHIPPEPGRPGRTVTGRVINPPQPGDTPLAVGPGTAVSDEDENLLVAVPAGAVTIDHRGGVEVRSQKDIRGDVDYSTGNIDFSGNLHILGTVRAGFCVKAKGDILIDKGVEDAIIAAEGALDIRGGASGSDKRKLSAGHTLNIRYIERMRAEAGGDILVAEDAIHAGLHAGGAIRAKSIVGGTACAGVKIELTNAGSSVETRTVLEVGGAFAMQKRKYGLLKNLAALTNTRGGCKEMMFALVRDGMNDQGKLSPRQLAQLEGLRRDYAERTEELEALESEISSITERIDAFPPSFIGVGTVFPGTVIRMGAFERVIRKKYTAVVFSCGDNGIKVSFAAERRGGGTVDGDN